MAALRGDFRQPIDIPVFRAQIGDVGFDAQRPRRALDQIVGEIFSPVPIDLVLEPGVQRPELAGCYLARDMRMRLKRSCVNLSSENVADGVALESAANAAAKPM